MDYGLQKPAKKKAKKAAPVQVKREVDDFKPAKKSKAAVKQESKSPQKGKGGKKGEKEEPVVWKWWEEEKKNDGTKWRFLEHRGPLFAPDYDKLPKSVR